MVQSGAEYGCPILFFSVYFSRREPSPKRNGKSNGTKLLGELVSVTSASPHAEARRPAAPGKFMCCPCPRETAATSGGGGGGDPLGIGGKGQKIRPDRSGIVRIG